MSSMADAYQPKLDLSRVASDAVSLLIRRPALYFGLSLVIAGVPSAISTYFKSSWWWDDESFLVRHHAPGVLISMLIAGFLEGCLFRLSFAEVGGRNAGLREVLESGLKFFLPLFAVNLLAILGIAAGCILLVVPGIILALMWAVVGPALLVERNGITEVFARSAQLTRDNRWRLFALLLIYAVVSSIVGDSAGYHYRYHWDSPMEFMDLMFSPIRIGVRAVLGSVVHAVAITAMSVIYVELRRVREGDEPTDLDSVFS